MNIHLIFYISLLELVLPGALPALIIVIEPIDLDAEYEIEAILNH